jgi:hypothetical protein
MSRTARPFLDRPAVGRGRIGKTMLRLALLLRGCLAEGRPVTRAALGLLPLRAHARLHGGRLTALRRATLRAGTSRAARPSAAARAGGPTAGHVGNLTSGASALSAAASARRGAGIQPPGAARAACVGLWCAPLPTRLACGAARLSGGAPTGRRSARSPALRSGLFRTASADRESKSSSDHGPASPSRFHAGTPHCVETFR